MSLVGRRIAVTLGSLVSGAVSFVIGFKALELTWMHLIVGDPKQTSLGDGVMVLGGGLLIGCAAGVSGLVLSLAHLRPKATAR